MTLPESGAPAAVRPRRLAVLAVCLAACVPYLRTISDYFVQDDFGVVQLLAGKPWSTFPRWFTMPWMEDIWGYIPDEIRPFPALSYQVTALWGRGAPEGHHLLNIALHAANALLVLALARSAGGLGVGGAAVAGTAFGLLPVAAESVAWITGRVDTMPTLFYVASFIAYVQWRQTSSERSGRLYAWSLGWFFLALFSKQNTITMVPALLAYDFVVARRPIRATWDWLRPYIPFVLLTAGFLGLRYLVLGEVLRESQLSSARIAAFGDLAARHVQRIAFGGVGAVPQAAALAGLFGVATAVAVARADSARREHALRVLGFFGVVWLALGIAPALAAGYESPRHAYLAAVGWAIALGMAVEIVWSSRPVRGLGRRFWPAVATLGVMLILGGYTIGLHRTVSDWSRRSAVSRLAATELETQVLGAPPGTLVLVGAPVSSWEWAAPFVARPPYASSDLTARAFIVTPRPLDCCRGRLWEDRVRQNLQAWATRPGAPVLALYATETGEVRRLTGNEDPELLSLVHVLPEIVSGDALDSAITDILRKLVGGRGHMIRTLASEG